MYCRVAETWCIAGASGAALELLCLSLRPAQVARRERTTTEQPRIVRADVLNAQEQRAFEGAHVIREAWQDARTLACVQREFEARAQVVGGRAALPAPVGSLLALEYVPLRSVAEQHKAVRAAVETFPLDHVLQPRGHRHAVFRPVECAATRVAAGTPWVPAGRGATVPTGPRAQLRSL